MSSGPAQTGRGVHGQRVYWVTMAHPGEDERSRKYPRPHNRAISGEASQKKLPHRGVRFGAPEPQVPSSWPELRHKQTVLVVDRLNPGTVIFTASREDAVQRLELKTPEDFTRESFRATVVAAHASAGVTLTETACFLEPHADGRPHLNLLCRSPAQYRWKRVAEELRQQKVHVNFGQHISTWADGVVYGCVASEHKTELDPEPAPWVAKGEPTPLKEFLPARFRAEGFVRKSRMSPLLFFDAAMKYKFTSADEAWAKAAELSAAGDRALLSFCMENDVDALIAKVQQSVQATERVRRSKMTREALLEEYAQKNKCTCESDGQC